MSSEKLPDFYIENQFHNTTIGVDEAGRGPMAGPVVAAAVILPQQAINWSINDSKKLSEIKRKEIASQIMKQCKYSIQAASVYEIDQINILNATMLAMRRAINKIRTNRETYVIVDGNKSPIPEDEKVVPVVRGDQKSISIAAASILAKVYRDGIMLKLHALYPEYNLHKNKGYLTQEHKIALTKYGYSDIHRKNFKMQSTD